MFEYFCKALYKVSWLIQSIDKPPCKVTKEENKFKSQSPSICFKVLKWTTQVDQFRWIIVIFLDSYQTVCSGNFSSQAS